MTYCLLAVETVPDQHLIFSYATAVLLYDFLRHVVDYVFMDVFDMYVSSRATRKWRRVMQGSAILAWSRFEVRGFR